MQEVTEQAATPRMGSLDLNVVVVGRHGWQLLTFVNMAHNIQKVS